MEDFEEKKQAGQALKPSEQGGIQKHRKKLWAAREGDSRQHGPVGVQMNHTWDSKDLKAPFPLGYFHIEYFYYPP